MKITATATHTVSHTKRKYKDHYVEEEKERQRVCYEIQQALNKASGEVTTPRVKQTTVDEAELQNFRTEWLRLEEDYFRKFAFDSWPECQAKHVQLWEQLRARCVTLLHDKQSTPCVIKMPDCAKCAQTCLCTHEWEHWTADDMRRYPSFSLPHPHSEERWKRRVVGFEQAMEVFSRAETPYLLLFRAFSAVSSTLWKFNQLCFLSKRSAVRAPQPLPTHTDKQVGLLAMCHRTCTTIDSISRRGEVSFHSLAVPRHLAPTTVSCSTTDSSTSAGSSAPSFVNAIAKMAQRPRARIKLSSGHRSSTNDNTNGTSTDTGVSVVSAHGTGEPGRNEDQGAARGGEGCPAVGLGTYVPTSIQDVCDVVQGQCPSFNVAQPIAFDFVSQFLNGDFSALTDELLAQQIITRIMEYDNLKTWGKFCCTFARIGEAPQVELVHSMGQTFLSKDVEMLRDHVRLEMLTKGDDFRPDRPVPVHEVILPANFVPILMIRAGIQCVAGECLLPDWHAKLVSEKHKEALNPPEGRIFPTVELPHGKRIPARVAHLPAFAKIIQAHNVCVPRNSYDFHVHSSLPLNLEKIQLEDRLHPIKAAAAGLSSSHAPAASLRTSSTGLLQRSESCHDLALLHSAPAVPLLSESVSLPALSSSRQGSFALWSESQK